MPAPAPRTAPRWLLAVVAGLAFWAVGATWLVLSGHPLDVKQVGSMAEWATAGVTLLALAAAAWAGVSASGQLAVMRRDADARDIEAHERQARLVFPVHHRARRADGGLAHLVTLENRSQAPITAVGVLFVGPSDVSGFDVGTVPPGSLPVVKISEHIATVITEMIGDRTDFAWVVETIEFEFPMLFTDAKGNRWHLRPGGELVPRPADYTLVDAQADALVTSRFHRT